MAVVKVLFLLKCQLLLILTSSTSLGQIVGQQKFRPRLTNGGNLGQRVPQVLPPVSKNPLLLPNDLRNKPPSVHVNFFPDPTTTEPPNYYPNYVPNVPSVPKISPIAKIPKIPDVRKTIKFPSLQKFGNVPNVPEGQKNVPRVPNVPKRRQYFENLPKIPHAPSNPQSSKIPIQIDRNFFEFGSESRPVTVDFARPNYNRRNDEKINLNTDYFIKKTERRTSTTTSRPKRTTQLTTRRKRRLTTVRPSRIPVLVKKLAKVPKKSKIPKIKKIKNEELCNGILECAGINEKSYINDTRKNYVEAIFPASWAPFLDVLRGEIWVVPVLVAAGFIAFLLIIFEIYLLAHTFRSRHASSRRHLFLGQMLLLGLILCCGAAIVHTFRPNVYVCSVSRIAAGTSYAIVYATLLVKLVFLVSLNGGVYLPATYQSLLLCFAILIQLVIGVQWLVSEPADVMLNQGEAENTIKAILSENTTTLAPPIEVSVEYIGCNVSFEQQMMGFLYVLFLVTMVLVLAFKAKGVRENYREAMYIGLTMGFTVCIFLVWILGGFIAPREYQDVCISCGLIATAAITFVIMFLPKGRQLSAMGRDGVYAEDRTDVYTGSSSTQSTGSGSFGDDHGAFGDPSPSFFPIKPPAKLVNQFKSEKDILRERLASTALSTPASPRKHTHGRRGRSRSKSPVKKRGHTGPEFHQNFHDWQRAGHRAIFDPPAHHHHRHDFHRFSSHQRPQRLNYYSESDYDLLNPRFRSRSSPPPAHRQHAGHQADFVDFGGVFSARDLHAANERRASRRDLADLRDQLFVKSTNDLRRASGRADRRGYGRDLLTRWEQQHCDKCNTLKRHSVSHHHLSHF